VKPSCSRKNRAKYLARGSDCRTAPACWILEGDLGLAPQGLDAATLSTNSLTVPALADKVFLERRADLETRSGTLTMPTLTALFCCFKDLKHPDFQPTAQRAAEAELVADLHH
jgi:hypothetical protein